MTTIEAGLAIGHDRRQKRLVDLMRDGRCELAEDGYSRGMCEVGLELAEPSLRSKPFGDIFQADECDIKPFRRCWIGHRKLHVYGLAVERSNLHDF